MSTKYFTVNAIAGQFAVDRHRVASALSDWPADSKAAGGRDGWMLKTAFHALSELDREAAALKKVKRQTAEMRLAQLDRTVIDFAECMAGLDEIVGTAKSRFQSLPARIAGRDLKERDRVEVIVCEVLGEIADIYARKAAELRTGAPA
jgi:hypothetical protein